MSAKEIPHPNKADYLKTLTEGELTITGQFMHSSNYPFLVQVNNGALNIPAVYKPQKGETPLWDFPAGTLCQREAAAFLVSEALGWELVPPTVFRKKAPLGKGAVQLFIEHDPQLHYFSFPAEVRQRLKPAALFDLIINNADRKGSHILLDEQGHLWLIDHGTCFHRDFKHRSVIWDFAGQTIPEEFKNDLQHFLTRVNEDKPFISDLAALISKKEIDALKTRIKILIELNTYPHPERNRRTIPWPPI
jgi:uncharacterized repeat protein (TIGR03843 family)